MNVFISLLFVLGKTNLPSWCLVLRYHGLGDSYSLQGHAIFWFYIRASLGKLQQVVSQRNRGEESTSYTFAASIMLQGFVSYDDKMLEQARRGEADIRGNLSLLKKIGLRLKLIKKKQKIFIVRSSSVDQIV